MTRIKRNVIGVSILVPLIFICAVGCNNSSEKQGLQTDSIYETEKDQYISNTLPQK